jgi:hypothetical protein
MRHDFVARIKTLMVVSSALLVVGSGLVLAQQGKDAPAASKKGSPKEEIISGVILKVEKVPRVDAKGEGKKSDAALLRLSINSNAVWRDWARDQAQIRDEGSPKKDAAKGAKSIATTGQPADENSVVVIEVTDATRVETRFRSPTDETSKGETSPEKVKSDEGTASKVPPKGKPVEFRTEDLLPGLFVEAEFRPSGTKKKIDTAKTVTVIRPINVPETAPASGTSPK